MGGFTRILHYGKLNNLLDEIPTIVVDPLPAGVDQGYIVRNRPWAFVQWLEMTTIDEEYVLMAEPDHVFQIHVMVMSLSYIGIEIKTAQSMESWSGGVLVMVSRSVEIEEYSRMRKFMRSFFLVPQENDLFSVLNDIFYYVEEDQVDHHQVVLLAQRNLGPKMNAPITINKPVIIVTLPLHGYSMILAWTLDLIWCLVWRLRLLALCCLVGSC